MTFMESVDLLRGRFVRCKGGKSLTKLAIELGIDKQVLSAFLKGTRAKVAVLEQLERWCDIQEGKEPKDTHHD